METSAYQLDGGSGCFSNRVFVGTSESLTSRDVTKSSDNEPK